MEPEAPDLEISQQDIERNVTRLRNTMPEHFCSFCKMHLSVVLDMDNESLDELLMPDVRDLKKKNFTPFAKKKIFEKSPQRGQLSQDTVSHIYQLIEYLGQESNLVTEGLFRKTGNIARQKQLHEQLGNHNRIDLSDCLYSPHDVANVLKGYLSDLGEPLLTARHFHAYCQIADSLKECEDNQTNRDKHLTAIQILILLLPRENSIVLDCLLDLLYNVTKVDENMMTAKSLGMVFTPHLICPRKLSASELQAASQSMISLIAFMIENAHELFKIPADFAKDISNFWKRMEDPNNIADNGISDLSLYLTTPYAKKKREPTRSTNDVEISTVISFTDQKGSMEARSELDTQVAVAELFATIQGMPDSSRKRKWLKQFNRSNGTGSPVQNKHQRSRSFGDVLKRRFANSVKPKSQNTNRHSSLLPSNLQDDQKDVLLSSPFASPPVHIVDIQSSRKRKSGESIDDLCCIPFKSTPGSQKDVNYICMSKVSNHLMPHRTPITPERVTSTKALGLVSFVSPITKSMKRASKYMQEAAMTPRSRAPLSLVVSP